MTNLNFCLAFPKLLPRELIELITYFTYKRSVEKIQNRIDLAVRSIDLPVPAAWLRYYSNFRHLNWQLIFDFSSDHMILISTVAETANLFHWSLMKHSRMTSSTLMKTFPKRDVVNTLRNWKRCSANSLFLSELVNFVWLALTGPYTLTKSSYLYYSLETINEMTRIDPPTLARYYRGKVQLPFRLFPKPNQLSIVDVMIDL